MAWLIAWLGYDLSGDFAIYSKVSINKQGRCLYLAAFWNCFIPCSALVSGKVFLSAAGIQRN
ncbi:hypothetical protein EPN15_02915 [Patescibacteria group bacterium]|nr:MAG: hypothetical protein EPN15_02915 [Patescibacteria group bacterium]